jgi:hypothetical protein
LLDNDAIDGMLTMFCFPVEKVFFSLKTNRAATEVFFLSVFLFKREAAAEEEEKKSCVIDREQLCNLKSDV